MALLFSLGTLVLMLLVPTVLAKACVRWVAKARLSWLQALLFTGLWISATMALLGSLQYFGMEAHWTIRLTLTSLLAIAVAAWHVGSRATTPAGAPLGWRRGALVGACTMAGVVLITLAAGLVRQVV